MAENGGPKITQHIKAKRESTIIKISIFFGLEKFLIIESIMFIFKINFMFLKQQYIPASCHNVIKLVKKLFSLKNV